MPKKNITPEDWNLFKSAIKGTKPLPRKHARVQLQSSDSLFAKPLAKKIENDEIVLQEDNSLRTVGSEDFIVFKHPSVPHKILRKLRKGQYNVEAILDLHGMTIAKAMEAIPNFLAHCRHKGIRVALIIHGKGRFKNEPVLKNKLNNWLRLIDDVLAFCSASPAHGSRGAIYVLLKQSSY